MNRTNRKALTILGTPNKTVLQKEGSALNLYHSLIRAIGIVQDILNAQKVM